MATVFIQTREGAAHDHAVRFGRAKPSLLAAIVCYSSTPVLDVLDIKDLTAATAGTESYRIMEADIPQMSIDPLSTLLTPYLPEQLDGVQINALGYVLENGVMWGYAPYRPDKGGLLKTNDFGWEMKLVCSSSDSPTLELRLSQFDLREIRDKLETDLSALIYDALLSRLRAELTHDLRVCTIDGNTECDPVSGSLINMTDTPAIDGGTV